jgi:hypothetical protein
LAAAPEAKTTPLTWPEKAKLPALKSSSTCFVSKKMSKMTSSALMTTRSTTDWDGITRSLGEGSLLGGEGKSNCSKAPKDSL